MGISKLDRVSYRIFGKDASSKAWESLKLQHELVQARVGVPFDIYISRAYFLSILTSLPAGLIAFLLMRGSFKLLGNYSFLIIPFLWFIFGLMFYYLMLVYPSIMANLRGRKIEIVLPHAVALMHALSRGSSNLINFFEIIAKNKKIYGEISEEVKYALVDTKILNLELKTALKNVAASTPSESFKNFLESLSTIISAGGDLVTFFLARAEQYRVKAVNENKAFMETLGLFSEIYVTGFVAGPLFIIVLLVVLGLVGGTKYILLLIIVYLLIPGGSLIFVVLLSSLTEGTSGSEFIRLEDNPGRYKENSLLQKGRMRLEVYEFLEHPLRNLIEVPEKVLFFSIPAGLMFFILTTHNYYGVEFNQLVYKIDDYIIFTMLIVLAPYSFFIEAHFRRINQISRYFPEFLNRLVSLHESGLTITASLNRLGSSNLGILTSEINKMNTDIELKGSIPEAFRNFGRRISTIAVQRVVVLIQNAVKMTGNIKDTLVIAADDAMTAKLMEEDRMRSAKMHIIIIYIAFFVFLYVIWALVTGFLPQIPEVAPEAAAAAQIAGEGIAFSGVDKALYVRLFFHASVLLGFFSGIVAGQMGEGDARLGLKHGLAMTVIAYILFAFIA